MIDGWEQEEVDPIATPEVVFRQGQIEDLTLPRGAEYDQDTYTDLAA